MTKRVINGKALFIESGANLLEADLWRADLREAKLEGAKLGSANLREAKLGSANLREAELEGADLWRAILDDANLGRANLGRANLGRANLQDADLREAKLEGADLWCANLGGANLWGANLEGANLQDASLEHANLQNVSGLPDAKQWVEANLECTSTGFYAYKTFGEHYAPPSHWLIEAGQELVEPVNTDRQDTCSWGINIGTHEWVQAHTRKQPWKVFVSWQDWDSVVVPYATTGKLRVSKCTLIETV